MQESPGLYQDATIYDVLHAPGTAAEIGELMRIYRRFSGRRDPAGSVWLEPACGTGRYLIAAARRGIRPIGFDSNQEMVAYARERFKEQARKHAGLPRAHIFCGDMTDFVGHMPRKGRTRADFAFNPINTIRHLETDAAMLAHLDQVARALKPGGVYAVGLSTTEYGLEPPSEDVWEGSRGRLRVKQIVSFIPPSGAGRGMARFEQVHSHLVITRGVNEEHRDSHYRLRTYNLRQWRTLISRSALRIAAVVDEVGKDIEAPKLGYGIWILQARTTRSSRND